jgi:hypothetical protein
VPGTILAMSLVLVVARPSRLTDPDTTLPADAPADALAAAAATRTDVWRAVGDELEELRSLAPTGAAGGIAPGALDLLAAQVAGDDDDPTVTYAHPGEAVAAVQRAIEGGAGAIAVVPVALAVDAPSATLRDPELTGLRVALDELAGRHPEVDLQYVGPPFHHVPALESAIGALRPAGSDEPALFAGAIERAFDGDLERFGRFMAALQAGVPEGTRLVLRGSAVQGASYKTGEPFDARGPGTSDLDVVLLGDEAMATWEPEAFYLAGVNTQPLDDSASDIADPRLERARREAQEAAGRPVALQAMARWFLDLRSGLQGTPYVVLGGG